MKKKRVKFDKDGNPNGSNQQIRTDNERIHKPRVARPHLAQEYRDRGSTEDAESITRRLLPHLRGRVQGLRDTHYRFPGFRSTSRVTQREEA